MVRVAFAGDSNVGHEIMDIVLSKNKHEVLILTRQLADGVKRVQVDFKDKSSLVQTLRDVDVVLSFLAGRDFDEVVQCQKNLIDACIEAGVKRFAPSEWGAHSFSNIADYEWKDRVRWYLEEINKDKKVLEYCLFQPGLFTNYFGYPYASTKHFVMSRIFVDFENRRAIIVGDGNYPITLTTVRDLGGVVTEALDFEGTWPAVGGLRGTQTTVADLIKLGEKLRGPFSVERVTQEDLKAGQLKTTWYGEINHPSIDQSQVEAASKHVTAYFVSSAAEGAWSVSDEWNRLLPLYRFTTVEEYLVKIWEGKS